jgi:hypothetical protein
LIALGSGTLEEQQFSFLMYFREWVLTGADKRVDFRDWLAGEGVTRFAVDLNDQWLASGHCREMSFEEWYVKVKPNV